MLSQQKKDNIKFRINDKAKDLYFEHLHALNQQITFKEAKEKVFQTLDSGDAFYSFFEDEENKIEIMSIVKGELCEAE